MDGFGELLSFCKVFQWNWKCFYIHKTMFALQHSCSVEINKGWKQAGQNLIYWIYSFSLKFSTEFLFLCLPVYILGQFSHVYWACAHLRYLQNQIKEGPLCLLYWNVRHVYLLDRLGSKQEEPKFYGKKKNLISCINQTLVSH